MREWRRGDEKLKQVTRYQCEFCKKDFKTPNKHNCKFNPKLKNCFSCKNFNKWEESDDYTDVGLGVIYNPNYPDCKAEVDEWDIEVIKSVNYNMQCNKWEQEEVNK